MQRNKRKDQVVFPIGTIWELSLIRGRSDCKTGQLLLYLSSQSSSVIWLLTPTASKKFTKAPKARGAWNGLESLVNALQGEGCFKKQSGVFVPKLQSSLRATLTEFKPGQLPRQEHVFDLSCHGKGCL